MSSSSRRARRQGHPGPGRRPGAKVDRWTPKTAEERRADIEKRISNEVALLDFTRRAVDLRRQNKTYAEIAITMSEEMGERVTQSRVRRAVVNALRNVEGTDMLRLEERDKLEAQAAKVLEQIRAYEEREDHLFDIEVYAKISETYLKYRERIAKLVGIDQGGNMGGKDVINGAAREMGAAASSQHLHLHVGSVDHFEEYQRLQEHGLVDLAGDVMALEAGDLPDVAVTGLHNDAAGTTLAPHVDTTPAAERQATQGTSLDALEIIDLEPLDEDS